MRCLPWLFLGVLLLVARPGLSHDQEPHLRNWYFGLKAVNSWYDTDDVFGQDILPADAVDHHGVGVELQFGRRFARRFVLGLQMVMTDHDVPDREEWLKRSEFLVTGTVLFRETSTLQPFLRGGFGGGLNIIQLGPDEGEVVSFGTAAICSGGAQVRLSSRFSLEFEAVATFVNFLEVFDNTSEELWPEESWQVRDSSWGWKLGAGLVFWF